MLIYGPNRFIIFLLVQSIFNTAGDVSAAQHSLETVLLEILLVCLLCVYRKDCRLVPPTLPDMGAGDTIPPSVCPCTPQGPRPVPSKMTNGLNEIGQLSIHA